MNIQRELHASPIYDGKEMLSESTLEPPADLSACLIRRSDGDGIDFVDTFIKFLKQANKNFDILYRDIVTLSKVGAQTRQRISELDITHNSSSSQVSGTAMPATSTVEEAGAAGGASSPSVAKPAKESLGVKPKQETSKTVDASECTPAHATTRARLLDTQEINYIVDALNFYADERDRIAGEGHGGRLERDSYRADAEDCWDLAKLIESHDITLECEATK